MKWKYFFRFHLIIVYVTCEFTTLPSQEDYSRHQRKLSRYSDTSTGKKSNLSEKPIYNRVKPSTIWISRWCSQDVPPIELARRSMPVVTHSSRNWCSEEFRRLNEPPPEVAVPSHIQPPRDLSKTGLAVTLNDYSHRGCIKISEIEQPTSLQSDCIQEISSDTSSEEAVEFRGFHCNVCERGPYITYIGYRKHLCENHQN